MKYLKVLLSQNIERAVMNSSGVGRGVWVWEVCVKRAFEENMVFDNTSFHGFSYSEEYAEYDDENNTWMESVPHPASLDAQALLPHHAGPLPGRQPHDAVFGWSSGELPAE